MQAELTMPPSLTRESRGSNRVDLGAKLKNQRKDVVFVLLIVSGRRVPFKSRAAIEKASNDIPHNSGRE